MSLLLKRRLGTATKGARLANSVLKSSRELDAGSKRATTTNAATAVEASGNSATSAGVLWKTRVYPRSDTLRSGSLRYEGGSLSSPHDSISRNTFAKNHAHLWTLLEACIDSNNLTRAESVLIGLSGLASKADITLACNNYLLRLCELNETSPSVGQLWIRRIQTKISMFEPNSVTDAIILKNIYSSGNVTDLQRFMKEYESRTGKSVSELLGHVEVLSIEALKNIVNACNIPLKDINEKYRDIIAASRRVDMEMKQIHSHNEAEEVSDFNTVKTVESGKDVEDIEYNLKKGISEVIPTGTVGLRTLRHSLSGLSENEDEQLFWEKVEPLLDGKKVEKGSFINFYELSRLIESPEKQKEFDILLDQFNEQRQRALESRGIESAREKWRAAFERRKEMSQNQKTNNGANSETIVGLRALDTLLWEWNEAMLPLVEDEFARLRKILQYSSPSEVPADIKQELQASNVSFADRFEYGPYLLLVKPEILTPVTMLELLRLNSTGGVSEGMRTARAVLSVGKTVEREYRARLLKEREKASLKGLRETGGEKIVEAKTAGAVRDAVLFSDLNTKQMSWPTTIKAKIGSLLISLLLQVARVTVHGTDPVSGETVSSKVPAFYHSYQYKNGAKLGVLKIHRNLTRHLSGEAISAVIQHQQLPMLAKPRPWVAYNKGGYLYSNTKIMRSRDSPEQVAYLKAASDANKLGKVYEGLNVLGSTAWTINNAVFDILLKVWNTGEAFLEIPPNVDGHAKFPPAPPRDCDPAVRRDWLRECRSLANEASALFSQRCDANYKLEIARAFLGERFYFPHNVDFRGRAYPLSPHLNHLGNDMARGLLQFWEAKPLGPNGLNWLKIHCANLYGYNKHSFEERAKFIDDQIEEVIDSANNPLEGRGWWKKSESPWQTLAVCTEIRNALQSGNPEKYKCAVPVHQDGSCNGLQHYAALGGDIEGGREVNLIPGDKPQDVYSRVLDIVKQNVENDVKNGSTKKIRDDASLVVNHLTRKIIKQTVMTNVYGVTFVGARAQIANKLQDVEGLQPHEVYQGSIYLARKVFEAVRSLFEGAHLIQDWLGDNAIRISKSVRLDLELPKTTSRGRPRKNGAVKETTVRRSDGRLDCMSSVIWTTPLSMPIVQPYRQDTKKQVTTALQSVFISDPYALRGVNTRKQRTAFPPNYIHSLDATHMLMSAIECGKKGITFAAVHDSYWTHAGDVDEMSTSLRECFIKLHEVDLIEQLRMEFEHRYTGLLQFCAIPQECELAGRIRKVQDQHAIRIYGHTRKLAMADQLEIERQRLHRLNNGEPDDIETPVSVIEQVPLEELEKLLIHTPEQMKAMGLGKRPNAKSNNYRSTEHEGSGSDLFAERELESLQVDESTEGEEGGSSAQVSAIDNLEMASHRVMGVFVPLRISKVPPKGNLDVRQLKDSKYFFS